MEMLSRKSIQNYLHTNIFLVVHLPCCATSPPPPFYPSFIFFPGYVIT